MNVFASSSIIIFACTLGCNKQKNIFFWISHHHKFACMATEGKMHTSFISSLMSSLAGSNSSRMRSQRAANQPHTSMKLYVRCKDTQESDRTIQTYLISSNSSHSLWTHTPPHTRRLPTLLLQKMATLDIRPLTTFSCLMSWKVHERASSCTDHGHCSSR